MELKAVKLMATSPVRVMAITNAIVDPAHSFVSKSKEGIEGIEGIKGIEGIEGIEGNVWEEGIPLQRT